MDRVLQVLVLALILGACALAYFFVLKYEAKTAEIEELKSAYSEAVAAQKHSEDAIKILQEENEQLLIALEQWKSDYQEIELINKDARAKINELEKENDEIRQFLDRDVPDRFWDFLFPKEAT